MNDNVSKTESHFITRILLCMIAAGALIALSSEFSFPQDRRQQQKQYQQPAQTNNETMIPNVIVAPGEDYRIGPSDVIEITVVDMPEISRAFRVGSDGQINIPFLGRLTVQEKTTDQLARLIEDKLRGDYLVDPQVSVAVLQINSHTYFIQGAVRRPGLYQVEGQPSLLKLITIAGGLSENYGSTAYIIREIKPGGAGVSGGGDPASQHPNKPAEQAGSSVTGNGDSSPTVPDAAKYELLKANINGLLRGNFDQNIAIGPGDIVHIPPTDVFFVAGEVNAPGSFPLKEGTTLRQAISLAQGATFQGAANRSIIFREDPSTGKRQEIQVDIPAIMNGKKEDLPILANDIVIIPNSRMKSVTSSLLKAFGVNSTRLPYRWGY